MTSLTVANVPLAVRVSNARVDQLITGYLHGSIQFQKSDPGGFKSASFVVNQRLGYRSDIIMPYSRIYIMDMQSGDVVFEGDVSHPGRSVSADGALLEVQVDGGMERLNDWSGPRVYCDSDLTAWSRNTSTSHSAASVDVGLDRGGSGEDALFLGLSSDTHVDLNYRAEAIYTRIAEANQDLGRINFSWDAGLATGWLLRLLVSAPSTVARSITVNTSGGGISAAYVGPSWTAGAATAFIQFLWPNAGGSSTGSTDVTWASVMDLTVVAYLWLKDGTRRAGVDTDDSVKADHVIQDLLGDPEILASTFDGPNARIDAGGSVDILQLVFPDGVTPMGVLDELMKFEPSCTYMVGPSNPLNDKYTLSWIERSTDVRYEFMIWTDEHTGGAQSTDQYDQVITRWKTPTGNLRFTTSTQSIPEMTAVGRHRRFFQDLSDVTGNTTNANNANSTVLLDHRFPRNGGQIKVQRDVVDLFTGCKVAPYQIEPGYLCRVVGINPSVDALNNSPRNGSTVCQVVNTDYDSSANSATIDLDAEPWSVFKAIAAAKKPKGSPYLRKPF
jgi:hypothetical protein